MIFTDAEAQRWRVYDWTVIAGHKYRREPGEQSAAFRGLLNEQTGERREYRFPDDNAVRLFSAHLLSQQLVEARLLPRRPARKR